MSNKNPFVNCKSRKRRKTVNNLPSRSKIPGQLKCPRSMVMYTNSPNEYKTVWFCKMCLTAVLSEAAIPVHVAKCKEAHKKPPPPPKVEEETRYICEFCNRVFSRKVTLKKHLEQHENTLSGGDSDVESPPFKQSTSSESTPFKQSTSLESTPFKQSTSSESAPFKQSTSSESAPFKQSTSSESAPFKQSTSSESTPFKQSTSSESAPFKQSTSSELSPFKQSTSSESAPFKQSTSSLDNQVMETETVAEDNAV